MMGKWKFTFYYFYTLMFVVQLCKHHDKKLV